MTDNNRTARLERQELAIEDEIEKRSTVTATERQIEAARGHNGRPQQPDYEEDRSTWSTSEWQAFRARGVRPLKKGRIVKPEDD